MKFGKLIQTVEFRLSASRKLLRLIRTPTFKQLYEISSDYDKNNVKAMILSYWTEDVRQWIRNHRNLEPGEMSVTQLKELAKDLEIVGGSRMSKIELIQVLQ